MQNDYQNPFDDERSQFLVLINEHKQQSIWPGFASIPQGWSCIYGPKTREKCINYLEQEQQ